jgi:hypothetical protein
MKDTGFRRCYSAFRSEARKSRWTLPIELGRVGKPVIFRLSRPEFDAKPIPIGKKIDARAAAVKVEKTGRLGERGSI